MCPPPTRPAFGKRGPPLRPYTAWRSDAARAVQTRVAQSSLASRLQPKLADLPSPSSKSNSGTSVQVCHSGGTATPSSSRQSTSSCRRPQASGSAAASSAPPRSSALPSTASRSAWITSSGALLAWTAMSFRPKLPRLSLNEALVPPTSARRCQSSCPTLPQAPPLAPPQRAS